MSGSKIQNHKYDALTEKFNEKTVYVNKYCILNNSMHCKKKWKEIRVLHKSLVNFPFDRFQKK